jgi:4-amino-4-deoxy-L-arabinose transferase-like glycosyltransferase
MTRLSTVARSLSLFAFSLFIFTIGINHTEVVSFDSRFYVFAESMWRHGFSWFPMTYGQPYPDYPVTSTLFIYLTSLVFGGLSKFTAVLPSAIAASFVVVYTKKIGELYHEHLGLAAVGLLFLTLAFMKSARAISLDMYPLLAATACFYHVARSRLLNKQPKAFVLACWFIFGFVMRGPVGLVIPAGVVSMFHLINRDAKRFFMDGLNAFFWLILGTSALLGLAYHVGGLPFAMDVSRMEVVGRIDNYFLPYTFYFTDSFGSYALAYPLAVLVFAGLVFASLKNKAMQWPHAEAVWQWAAWALVILIGLSLPGDKKVRYILSITPAIALMAAYPLMIESQSVTLTRLRGLFGFIFAFLPLFFMIGLFKVMIALPKTDLTVNIPYWPLLFVLFVLQVVSLKIFFFEKKESSRGLKVILLAALSFIAVNLAIIEPIELNIDSAKVFVNEIEAARAAKQAALVFYKERPDGLPIKYLVNMDRDDDPVFVETAAALMKVKNPAIIVSSKAYYTALTKAQKVAFRVISSGKIGHVPVVVFTPVK